MRRSLAALVPDVARTAPPLYAGPYDGKTSSHPYYLRAKVTASATSQVSALTMLSSSPGGAAAETNARRLEVLIDVGSEIDLSDR